VADPRHARARLDARQSALLQGPEVDSQLGIEKRARREIWVDRDKIDLPEQFRSRAASLVANIYSTIGMGFLAFGRHALVRRDEAP